MCDDIAIVHDDPAVAGQSAFETLLMMFLADAFGRAVCKRVQHPVTGAGADDKIIGKGSNIFYIEQDNIFSLFIFQGIDNGACKFECVQGSPHGVLSGADDNCV